MTCTTFARPRAWAAALVGAFACLLAAAPAAHAQAWPAKPIRWIIPFPPGGPADINARMIAPRLSERLGQQVVVDNRPGAASNIGYEAAAKAAPDGYTMVMGVAGLVTNPHLYKLAFDPLKDLVPIGLIVTVPNVLVVGAQVPVNNVGELVRAMKAKPGDFKYASSGVGSTQHIAGEAFDAAAGTKSQHIPYKGSSQAHLDIIGGSVQMMFDTPSSAMGQIKGGKFKALAVTTPARSPQLPDVPTLSEAGVKGADMSTWYALYVTAGTPADVVAKLQGELARVLKLPDVDARLKGLGGEPSTITPAQFADLNKQEFERFGKLIKDAGIKLQ